MEYHIESYSLLKQPLPDTNSCTIYSGNADVPDLYEEAIRSNDSHLWKNAIKEELDALEKNGTWELTELPSDKKAISSEWVFKVKRLADGTISRYKARLCAKGFAQKQEIDYHEIFPPTTRYKYSSVSFIIDLLEIEIQKPSKAVHQALTWSEYKKANTLKYLNSCTPDVIINYISPGSGGRISDVLLVEYCNYLETLAPGAGILADRGFKHLEELHLQQGFQLLRPPSVATGSKLSKANVRQTKEIASLRIHIERVIRRIREFLMLTPHSVL